MQFSFLICFLQDLFAVCQFCTCVQHKERYFMLNGFQIHFGRFQSG